MTSFLNDNKIKSEKINELMDNLIEILSDENKKVTYIYIYIYILQ